MDNTINLVKLSVGTETVKDLIAWQKSARAKGPDGLPRHVTRMWPRREAELLNGGSVYWVIKGAILARQTLVRLDQVDRGDGITRCALVLDPTVYRTEATPKRPFQGWRYLPTDHAPRDLSQDRVADADAIPPRLLSALADIGVR